ncbi:hypothetical protein BY996DRAFT_6408305 [Phakopsora pachyrhizi]|nr:hypothetical protein BY996DRAFT_6408305 [Phakopsora pachyrhizi]
MTSLVPTSTHAISKGTLGSIILGAVVLIVSPTLNRVLVEDLPSKHPDYPLLTPNFQANLQVVCDPVSTLDSAAAEEEEDVGAPQFTNFLVYEVDNQGQVVHLKDINDPCASEESQDKIVKSKPVSLVECPVDSEVKLLEILCTSELEILKQFVSQGPPSNAERRESKKPTTETKKSESDEKLYKQSNDGNPDNESAVSSVISKVRYATVRLAYSSVLSLVFRLSLFNQASHPTNQEGGGTNHERDRLKIENLEKRLEDLEIVKDLRSRAEIWKEIRWLKDLETQVSGNKDFGSCPRGGSGHLSSEAS